MPFPDPRGADVCLERDAFFRTLLRYLTGALDEVVGVREGRASSRSSASGWPDELGAECRRTLGVERLPTEQLGAVRVGRPSLCMTTSNVFVSSKHVAAAEGREYVRE